jgi:hypothetical protein
MASETTEKIVEAYVRYVKGWATIPNIKCKGQYEIDLLAIDSITGKRYHVESGVSISEGFSKLTGEAYSFNLLKQRTKQASQRRTVGYFRDRKFSSPEILAKLAEYGFRNMNYNRIIVSWGWTDDAKKQADTAGIELWDFRTIMVDIANKAYGREYFTDDTLRTLQLLVKSLQEKGGLKPIIS